MHPRIRIRFALLLAITAAPAAAQVGIGTCVMGEARNATGGLLHELEFGLVIHQWMDPATCGFCLVSDGAIELRTIELEVFTAFHPSTSLDVPATVSVIGWKGSLACPIPDESVVIVPPRAITFVVPLPTFPTTRVEARAPFGPSPQFVSPAFLKVEFPVAPSGSIPIAPGEVVSLTCGQNCRQYQTSALGARNLADACGDPILYPYTLRPRGDCVTVTSARRTTWSQLKLFYH